MRRIKANGSIAQFNAKISVQAELWYVGSRKVKGHSVEVDRTKHNRLIETMDTLNARFGRHRLVTAAEGFEPFKMNRNHLSQQYTTDWKQIIKVKI